MENPEISAFATYSSTKKSKKKKENGLSFKTNSKNKVKKKNKHGNRINGIVSNLVKVAESNGINLKSDIKKNKVKENIIKTLLNSKQESLFEDCSLTVKVDNDFLKEGKEISKKEKSNKKPKNVLNGEIKKVSKKSNNLRAVRQLNFNTTEPGSNLEIPEISKLKKKKIVEQKNFPNIIYSDSVKLGEETLSWILSPMTLKDFFENCWEQKPLHVKHNNESYFQCLCTLKDFSNALLENDMYFTRNIDVTSYVDGQRVTENPEGKAKPSVVWDLYNSGKSIRLLNPQTFIPNIRLLNTTLQEFFQCFVGANIYLTPAGTQGFAPHYDDIEAFVLQLEGEKHWKLYNPRTPDEVLPRESSRNFSEEEVGEPILEVTLKPGDLLYFPRGMIHQAKCLPHIHSLHITVSCYQKNSWADLMEKVLPAALQNAIAENVEFRKGLPIGYLNHLGMVYYDGESDLRKQLIKKFKELLQKVVDDCPLDAAIDQLGAKFMHDALPPFLTEEEKIYGASRDVADTNKSLLDALKNYSDKSLGVKLIRATSVRLVSEEDDMVMYYTTDNSLVYQEHEVQRVTVPELWAQAIDHLIRSYPKFVDMQELPVSTKINKPAKWNRIAEFVYFLWQKGLLLFDKPLRQIYS